MHPKVTKSSEPWKPPFVSLKRCGTFPAWGQVWTGAAWREATEFALQDLVTFQGQCYTAWSHQTVSSVISRAIKTCFSFSCVIKRQLQAIEKTMYDNVVWRARNLKEVGVVGRVRQAADFDPETQSLHPVWDWNFFLFNVNCCPKLKSRKVFNFSVRSFVTYVT